MQARRASEWICKDPLALQRTERKGFRLADFLLGSCIPLFFREPRFDHVIELSFRLYLSYVRPKLPSAV